MRYSTIPSKQLLYMFLDRDMKKYDGWKTGIDAGAGYMQNRPFFKTDYYYAIDCHIKPLMVGKMKYPEARIVYKPIQDIETLFGDIVLCVQVFTGNNIHINNIKSILESLTNMIRPEGDLIINFGMNYLFPFWLESRLNKIGFNKITATSYGMFSKPVWFPLSFLLAHLMLRFPILRGNLKTYYKCEGKK